VQHFGVTKLGLLMTVTIGAFSLVACGGDNTGDVQTVTVAAADSSAEETPTSAPKTGEAILIETHADATNHTSEVLAVSFIGESAFCPGGTGTGGSEGATITSTFHCPGGELTVEFAPMQHSLVQGAAWRIVSGTGTFSGMHGGGSMVAKFEDPETGREIFTGTVSN
jgi:hypothetical protein